MNEYNLRMSMILTKIICKESSFPIKSAFAIIKFHQNSTHRKMRIRFNKVSLKLNTSHKGRRDHLWI